MWRIGMLHSVARAYRKTFDCGHPDFDRYLAEEARQAARCGREACWVALQGAAVVGYYTLRPVSVLIDGQTPRRERALLLERLAVDRSVQRRGLGSALLAHAIERAPSRSVGRVPVIARKPPDVGQGFLRHHGFEKLPQSGDWVWIGVPRPAAPLPPEPYGLPDPWDLDSIPF